MDTSKLITVVVWATIAVIAYELFKQLSATASGMAAGNASLLGFAGNAGVSALNSPANLATATTEALGNVIPYTANSVDPLIPTSASVNELGLGEI